MVFDVRDVDATLGCWCADQLTVGAADTTSEKQGASANRFARVQSRAKQVLTRAQQVTVVLRKFKLAQHCFFFVRPKITFFQQVQTRICKWSECKPECASPKPRKTSFDLGAASYGCAAQVHTCAALVIFCLTKNYILPTRNLPSLPAWNKMFFHLPIHQLFHHITEASFQMLSFDTAS